MNDFLSEIIENLTFILARLNWLSLVDVLLVASVFFLILQLLKETQAMVLIRGVLILFVLFGILTSFDLLPAFSWLVRTTLPAILFAIPVIFAPEIRRTLERLGRAGTIFPSGINIPAHQETIKSVVNATIRLADRQYGALIIMQRLDGLDDYTKSGVHMDSKITSELLLQIFYPNTPLHDGAVIISGTTLVAAACVLPLSSSGVLTSSPERQMGLRHRAALGISEVSDAVAVVVSEETGFISIVHGGRMIRRLDSERLENMLIAFYQPVETPKGIFGFLKRLLGNNRADSRNYE